MNFLLVSFLITFENPIVRIDHTSDRHLIYYVKDEKSISGECAKALLTSLADPKSYLAFDRAWEVCPGLRRER